MEPWSVRAVERADLCAHTQLPILYLSLYLGDLYEGQYAKGKKHGHGKYAWYATIDVDSWMDR